jgi:hypothetical protein
MRISIRRILAAVCRQIIQVALRVLVTFLVFGVCLMATLRYLGIPLPSPNQLLDSLEGVSELAKILS